jgi:phosphatidylserine decarboxylase
MSPYKVTMSHPEIGHNGPPSVRWRFPSVHPDGRKFVVISAGIALVFALLAWETLAWPMLGVTIWVAAFFRDPIRSVPRGDDLIIAPADGLITLIRDVLPPREMAGEGGLGDATMTRVSIFMSVFDVHIQRSPIEGIIRQVIYISGKFLNADLDKASEDNERQHILVERRDGLKIGYTMIAGLVARRIVPFVKPGDTVVAGQRVGLIRFGSRVDVYLPAGTAPRVALGQRTIAGETILGVIGNNQAAGGISQ